MEKERQKKTFCVQASHEGMRLDKALADMLPDISRSLIQHKLKEKSILVNQKPQKASYHVTEGDSIDIIYEAPKETKILPENLPLDILYEDQDLLIVNKAKGMVVHPAAGHATGTLVNAVLWHCRDSLSGINGELRPGIVHRIDMNTTGSLIVCKNDSAHIKIAEQIKEHSIKRVYQGIVIGEVKEAQGTIHKSVGRHPKDRKKMAVNTPNGKDAVTHYRILKRFRGYTYMEFVLETGRTHQIRVHMASIGHPLLGDNVYGPSKSKFHLEGQTLHAKTIGFLHPSTKEYLEVNAPLPAYFTKLLEQLPEKI